MQIVFNICNTIKEKKGFIMSPEKSFYLNKKKNDFPIKEKRGLCGCVVVGFLYKGGIPCDVER